MGTYAELYSGKDYNTIPDNKKKEFAKRIERLFQEGGMMRIKPNILFGKRVYTIHKVKMGKNGVHFNYNYFEENEWETAGFDRESYSVFSGELGHEEFFEVMVAAYVLEEQYVEEIAVVKLNGYNVSCSKYIDWINYLFNERYHIKFYNSWKIFDLFYALEERDCRDEECTSVNGCETQFEFRNTIYAFVAKCEIYAVLYGTEKAIEKYKQGLKEGTLELTIMKYLEECLKVLNLYKAERKICIEGQLSELKEMIQATYENREEEVINQDSILLYLRAETERFLKILTYAFVVKGIAELYNQEFWELWKQMGINGLRYWDQNNTGEENCKKTISSNKFLEISPDNLIYFWDKKDAFSFSAELYRWFEQLKEKFDNLTKKENVGLLKAFKEEPLRHIVDVMEAAEENYYHILTFTEFLEETKENIEDKRYWALWKIYEDMVFDPQLIKAGSVIFAPEGTENKRNGFWEYKRNSKKVLIDDWVSIPKEKKNNDGRKILRRYMALMANKKLRRKVFGG